MNRLRLFYALIVAILLLGSCAKDPMEELPSSLKSLEKGQTESKLSLSEKINAFVDNIPDAKQGYGSLDWDKAIVYETPEFQFYVIPFDSPVSDSVEHSITAFSLPCSGEGCYIALNDRIFFDYVAHNRDFKPDLAASYYARELDYFARFNNGSTGGYDGGTTQSLEIIIIIFNDGAQVEINLSTGTVTFSAPGGNGNGNGEEGCFNNGGIITFWDGSSFVFHGNEWSIYTGSEGLTFSGIPGLHWHGPSPSNTGPNGSGGGGEESTHNQPFNCQDASAWSTASPRVKRQATEAIDALFDIYGLVHCEEQGQNNCMTAVDVACIAFAGGCMRITNGEFDVQHFNECMASHLDPEAEYPSLSIECAIKAENYIIGNGVDMTPEELIYVTNAYEKCGESQHDFDDFVCKRLQRHWLSEFSQEYGVSFSAQEAAGLLASLGDFCGGQEAFYERVQAVWEEQHNEGWFTRPLDANRIWQLADNVKARLLDDYPEKAALINQLFPCRVLGPALENAVLESLGRNNFASTNSSALLPGLSRKPDGYHKVLLNGASPAGYYHTFTEVKGVFSTAQNPVFDYSNQMGQFTDYITWLRDNKYQGIVPNEFYLVLPAGVAVDENLITTASNANIQFIVSGLEQSLFNEEEIRVSKPVCQNFNQIVLPPNLFCGWCARLFSPINGLYGLFGQFDYETVNLMDKINEAAAAFEASHLVNNNPSQDCPED